MRKFATLVLGGAVTVGLFAAPAGAATSDDTTKFCDANFQISVIFNQLPDGEPTAKQITAIQKQLNPQLTAALKSAPSEIKTDVTTAVTALKKDVSSLFTDDAVGQAGEAIDEWATTNCDYQTVDVTAANYSFTGIPSKLETGKTQIVMTNAGSEPHVMVVVRNKGKMTTEQILELPEKQAMKQIEELGAAYAAPGETGTGYFELKTKGDYIALCPIAQGSTADSEGTGPPHFTQGMVAEFTVS